MATGHYWLSENMNYQAPNDPYLKKNTVQKNQANNYLYEIATSIYPLYFQKPQLS